MLLSTKPFALFLILSTLLFHSTAWSADDKTETTAEREIHYLIQFVAESGATFTRNGDEHPAADAADHLAMKYRRASRYAKTAEDFIDNLASKSSITRKPYTVLTADGKNLTSHDWLYEALKNYRESSTHHQKSSTHLQQSSTHHQQSSTNTTEKP